jgi:hypothetical protein
VAERRRTRYPRIYEHTARSGRRRYQVVFRTSRTVDATQRAASLDTLRDARGCPIGPPVPVAGSHPPLPSGPSSTSPHRY